MQSNKQGKGVSNNGKSSGIDSMELQKNLALIIECQAKQDSSIKHEWLMDTKADAVRLANYLRGHGFAAKFKERKILSRLTVYYVGVDFKTLIDKTQLP